jgi:ring-1,2-phenylacetyl-CoA epoxidase subunit PaaC
MALTVCDPKLHVAYLLRLADSPLILGQRLSELTGSAPTLEEETAQANMALDLLGQAQLLLEHAAELEGAGRSADDLAFLRDEHEYTNLLIVERPARDFAEVVVRNLIYSAWATVLWNSLLDSSDATLAAIAAKAQKETAYHARHAAGWAVRLGDGTDDSAVRMMSAIAELWPYAHEAFAGDEIDEAVARAGIAPHCSTLEAAWNTLINDVLERAQLAAPTGEWSQTGGKQGRHTEALGYVLAEMQYLQRAHPGATW